MRRTASPSPEPSVSRALASTRSLLVLSGLWLASGLAQVQAAQCVPGGYGPPPAPAAPPPPPPAPGPTTPGPAGPTTPGPAGPSTPGPAGPSTPGPGAAGPSTPGPSGPGAPGSPAPSTPGARAPLSPDAGPVTPKVAETTTCSGGALADATSWQYWWENNKYDYVDLRGDLRSLSPMTPQGGLRAEGDFFRGMAPTPSQVQGQIVPDLLKILENEKSVELRRNALIALAKIGAEPTGVGGARLQEIIVDQVGSDDAPVAEAALVSLGLLGDWSSASVLSSILHDTKAGRKVLDRSKIPTRTRAHAGYALGLLAQRAENADVRRYVATILTQPFPGERGAQRELRVACVTSMGLTRLEACGLTAKEAEERSPSSCLESEIAWLTSHLENKREDDMVRAHAATALGRLAAALHPLDAAEAKPEVRDPKLRLRVLEALLEPLGRGKRTPSAVQQSCVLALGSLGDSDDDRIDSRIRKELNRVSADSDVATRQFALVALAQVASRRGQGSGEAFAGAHEVRQRLLSTLSRGKSRSKPWAALGLGILGHHLSENGGAASADAELALRSAFQSCKSPDDVGAYAIALALRGGKKNSEFVQDRLDDFSTDNARGDLALACGMLGASSALEELRAMNEDAGNRPAVLAQSAIALRLLGDREVTPTLSLVLEEEKSLAPRIAVTAALGQVGDRRAVDPLCRALNDLDRADHARAYAAMALGQVADSNRRPWQASLSRGFNHLALASALSNGDGTGLLEMP